MGIIKQGILGGFSGKVGSVVGTSWKGRAVMKAMPLSVANPRSTGQVNQRTKFSACVELAKDLLGGSIATFDNPFAGNISGYNRFVKRNVSAFMNDGTPQFYQISISEGALGVSNINGVPSLNIARDAVAFDVVSIDSPYNLDSDKAYAVVIANNGVEVLASGGVSCGTRIGGQITIPLNRPLAANEEFTIYWAYIRDDKKYASNTNTLTVIIP